MRKTTKIIKFAYWLLMILLVIIACLSAMSVLGLPKSFRAFVVQSGSMSPALKVGSIVFVQPEKQYNKGDIITFKAGGDADIKNPQATITHRIVAITQNQGGTFYTTKGDANDSPDMTLRLAGLVLGKVVWSVPLIGYPVGFIKTQVGFILLIVIPATIIIYSELLTIKNESIRLIKERRTRKLTPIENVEEKIGEEINEVETDVKKLVNKSKKNKKKKK